MITVANIIKDFENSGSGYSQVNNLFFTFAENGHHNHAVFMVVLDKILSSPARIYRGVKLSENEGVIQFDKLAKLSGISKGSVSALLDKLIDLGLYEKRTVSKMVIVRKVWIDAYKKQQTAEHNDNEVENVGKYLPMPLHAKMKLVIEQSLGRKVSSAENAEIKRFYWKIHGIIKVSKKAIGDVKITEDDVVNGSKFFMIFLPSYIRYDKGRFTLNYILYHFEKIQGTVQENKEMYKEIQKWWNENPKRYDALLTLMSGRGIVTKEHAIEEICKICSLQDFANPFPNDTETLHERQHRFVIAEISKREKITL